MDAFGYSHVVYSHVNHFLCMSLVSSHSHVIFSPWGFRVIRLSGVSNCEGKHREDCVRGKPACVTSIELLTYLVSVGSSEEHDW